MHAMPAQAIFIAFVVSLAVLVVLLSRFGRGWALDRPNERSLHERPVPRTGGIAIVFGAASALALGAQALWLPMLLAMLLAAVSFADDLRGLPTLARLGAHVAAAGALVWMLVSPVQIGAFALLVITVVWVTNLYNFMDGSDGIAGGAAVIGFGAYALGAQSAGDSALVLLASAIAAACAAFLLLNYHPARIFMGDVGSIPLGFLAAGLGLWGWHAEAWTLWFPLLVFGPFLGDATLTLLKRLARGERVWQPHREHYYQRMVRMGLGHRGTAWCAYAAIAGCSGAALASRDASPAVQVATFVAVSVVLAGLAALVDLNWRRIGREGTGDA
jgi:UDP-N-acetylmuramyl pentapeptide phosphotransferase/UDP-N-acetylglucosamine-1-phosphate transferase